MWVYTLQLEYGTRWGMESHRTGVVYSRDARGVVHRGTGAGYRKSYNEYLKILLGG